MTKENFEKARYLRELIAILESQRNTIDTCSYSLQAIFNDAAKGFGNYEDIMDELYYPLIDKFLSRIDKEYANVIKECEEELKKLQNYSGSEASKLK